MRFIVLLLLVAFSWICGQEPTWTYDRNYRDSKLYLHALVNYDMPASWYYQWEENFYSRNGIKLSFGSIEANKLLSDFRANLNIELSDGLWFRNINRWYGSQHRNTEEKSFLLGMDLRVWSFTNIFLMFDPALNKDEIDSYFGFYFADTTQTNYLRIGLYLDDFDFEKRNESGGMSVQDPKGMQWYGRFQTGAITLFSEGKWSTGFERSWPDSSSSEMIYHSGNENEIDLKAYYHFNYEQFLQLGYWYYDFSEGKDFRDPSFNYRYGNRIDRYYGRYEWIFAEKNRLRFHLDYIIQEAEASGYHDYNYNRTDLMPSLFYERFMGKHIVELGVMLSSYEWDYKDVIVDNNYMLEDRVDKVKLGWTYIFSENSQLQLSISHVFSIEGFGGGNVMYFVYF